jgi:hypothetical protein
MHHHFDGVADAQQFGIDCERELAEGKDAFGFSADVDEHFVFVFLNDRAGKDLAFVENFERFFVEALLERELIFFVVSRSGFSRSYLEFPTFVNFLFLTAPAPPRPPLREHGTHDARAAAKTRPAVSAVDREVVLKTTLQSVRVYVVVDARTAHVDGAAQNVDDGAT